jgi:hypothetical protein
MRLIKRRVRPHRRAPLRAVSHSFPTISAVFDDPNVVSCAKLAPTLRWRSRPIWPTCPPTLPNARVGSFVDDSLITALFDDTAFADRNRAYFLYALLVLELCLEQESNDVVNG